MMATVPYSADLPDVDPAAEADRPTGTSRLILWLVVASLAILLLPLFLISTTIKSANLALENQLAEIQATLVSTPKQKAGDQALKDKLLQIVKQTSVLEAAQPTLVSGHIDWLGVVNTIAAYDPEQITLVGLSQPDNRLVLTGQADDESTVMIYAQILRDSSQFKRVIVQSITLKAPPTAAAAVGKAAGNLPEAVTKPAEFTISLELKSDSTTP